MAVTATFKADFTDFTRAVGQAEKDLASLEKAAGNVDTTFRNMRPELFAKKLKPEVDAAGGSLQGLLGTAGKLAGAIGIGFSVGAVVSFTKAIIATQSELVKLAAKTGISTEGLQRLQIVGDSAGNTLGQLTAAVTQMQKRLASGESHQALQGLGLDIAYIKSLQPDQQFIAIATAIGKIEDPMKRTAAATAAGGKAMVEALPTIVAGFQQVADESLIVEERATKAWERLGNSLATGTKRFTATITEDFGNMIANVQGNIDRLGQITDNFQIQISRVAAKPLPAPAGIEALPIPENLQAEIRSLQQQQDELKKSTEASKKFADESKKLAEEVKKTEFGVYGLSSAVHDVGVKVEPIPEKFVKARVAIYDIEQASQAAAFGMQGLLEGIEHVGTAVEPAMEGAIVKARALEAAYQRLGVTSSLSLEMLARAAQEDLALLASSGTASLKQLELAEKAAHDAMIAYQKSTQEAPGFFSKAFDAIGGSFKNFAATGLSGIVGMFTGSGGIGGAATSMAKTITSSVLGVIPVVGPFLSQFAGPMIDGIKAIGSKMKELFGGPNAAELAGREVVDKFQANIASMLNQTQKVESGNVEWKATVIGIRDAYIAQGLTAEEAMADAEKLWAATSQGAEASQAVVDLVRQKMQGMAEQTQAATTGANALANALQDVGRAAANIDFPSGTPSVGVPGYARGTGGRFVNFGQGTLALLHGQERVMTKDEAPGTDPAMLGALQAIRRDLQRQPELIALQLRAALAQA